MSSNTNQSQVTSTRPQRRATAKTMEKMREEIERLKKNGIDLDMSSDDEEFDVKNEEEEESEDIASGEDEDSDNDDDDEDDY